MARYETEFVGMSAGFMEPRGLDPNYQGGYRGMRMGAGNGRAAYGAHRLTHSSDLGTEGGFPGIHPRSDTARPVSFDPRWEEHGGVGDPHRTLSVLHDFDARSPMYSRPDEPRRDGRAIERLERLLPDRWWTPERSYRAGYSNRGLTDAGYSEGWARGPMRGAR